MLPQLFHVYNCLWKGLPLSNNYCCFDRLKCSQSVNQERRALKVMRGLFLCAFNIAFSCMFGLLDNSGVLPASSSSPVGYWILIPFPIILEYVLQKTLRKILKK